MIEILIGFIYVLISLMLGFSIYEPVFLMERGIAIPLGFLTLPILWSIGKISIYVLNI